MAGESTPGDSSHRVIRVTGLGPGDFDRIPGIVQEVLLDPKSVVIVRTLHHPAAEQLASLRDVITCDDLYESRESFEDVYAAVAERVAEAGSQGDVVYAVPGSPLVGEFAVRHLIAGSTDVEVIPAESFVDAILAEIGYDPFDRGLQILNGHELPYPLVIDKPTIVGHLDRPEVLGDVVARLGRAMPEETVVTLFSGLGSVDGRRFDLPIDDVDPSLAGFRTSIFVDSEPGGLVGAVRAMAILREECPWDREQTHQTLVKYLIEESYELIDAISGMRPDGEDWAAYALIEDELGDVLLQVLFHATIARQAGAFDIDDVAEVLRQKLVRRHPHVFGDVEAGTADEVKRNWDLIKDDERGGEGGSGMDGVPHGMPSLHRAAKIQNRAAKVGFDWPEAIGVLPKIREEVEELADVLDDPRRAESELGDVLFSVVNLSRHLHIDPELALRGAIDRFETRFRAMEAEGPLAGLDMAQLDQRWERAKD